MAHDPRHLREIIADAAPPDLELTFRPMFGGIMVYAEGKPFSILLGTKVALKAKGPLFAEFLGVEGSEPLRYAPDAPPSKSYVAVPEAMLADREALRDWIARAAAML
jgi:TfoX/Sxy family transcriptional regulator of competence genes